MNQFRVHGLFGMEGRKEEDRRATADGRSGEASAMPSAEYVTSSLPG